MENANENKKEYKLDAIKGTYYVGLSQVASSVCNYIFLTVITTIGAEKYGLWTMALLLAGYVTPWASLGLESALEKILPTYKNDVDKFKIYWFSRKCSLLFSSIVTVIIFFFSQEIATLLFDNAGAWFLVVCAALIFVLESQLIIGFATIRSKENMQLFSLFGVSRALIDLLLIGGVALFFPEVNYLLVVRIGILLLLNFVQHFAVCRMYFFETESQLDEKIVVHNFFQYGFLMVPANCLWLLIAGIDRFMINHFGSVSDVGIYNLADSLALSVNNFSKPINAVIKPRLANVFHSDPSEMIFYLQKSIKYLLVILLPLCLIISLFAQDLIRLFFVETFLSASRVLPILSIAHLLIALIAPLSSTLFLNRGGKPFIYLLLFCLLANVFLNMLLIPLWNIKGAAFATLFCHIAYVIALFIMSDKPVRNALKSMYQLLLNLSIGLVIMSLPFFVLSESGFVLNRLITLPMCLLTYFLYIWKRGIITEGEMQMVLFPFIGLYKYLILRNK